MDDPEPFKALSKGQAIGLTVAVSAADRGKLSFWAKKGVVPEVIAAATAVGRPLVNSGSRA